MGDATADDHHARADRAERLADDARQRIARARAAADRHERLALDRVTGEPHRRAAALYRDAELIYEQAARLQLAHAAHERRAADDRERVADARDRAADDRERVADARDRAADDREHEADARDRAADDRERAADERDRIADVRARAAADRDAVATAREDQIDARERALILARPDLGFIADQREHLAQVHAAIRRAKERIITHAPALRRHGAPTAPDTTAVHHESAGP